MKYNLNEVVDHVHIRITGRLQLAILFWFEQVDYVSAANALDKIADDIYQKWAIESFDVIRALDF